MWKGHSGRGGKVRAVVGHEHLEDRVQLGAHEEIVLGL